MNKNILFIAYYFNPIKGIGTIRNSKMAKYLALKGWNVYTLSTSNYRLFRKEDVLKGNPQRLKVWRTFTFDYQTAKLILLKLSAYFGKNIIVFNPLEKPAEMSILNFLNYFPFNIFIGEGGLLYIILNVAKAFFMIKKYRIETVFTSFSPFSDIFTGYILKLIFPNLKWVADFRDLHIKKFGINFFTRITHIADTAILKKADFLTTVSNGLAQGLCKYSKKVHVLKNGFDPDDMALYDKTRIELFSFLYTGTFYKSKYNIDIFLQCLSKITLEKKVNRNVFRFIYAGRQGSLLRSLCQKYNIDDNFYDMGFIDRAQTLKLQANSFFLVLLTWCNREEKGILTGKFYEYLFSGRPIICIVNGDRDSEIEKIFRETKAGILVYSHEADVSKKLEKFILKYYKKFKYGNSRYANNLKRIYKFSYKNLIDNFSKLLYTV